MAGGGVGGGAYHRLLRYVSILARLLNVMTDWVQVL